MDVNFRRTSFDDRCMIGEALTQHTDLDLEVVSMEGAVSKTSRILLASLSPCLKDILISDTPPSRLVIPDVPTQWINHLLNVLKQGYTTGPGMGDAIVKGMKETAKILGLAKFPILSFEVEGNLPAWPSDQNVIQWSTERTEAEKDGNDNVVFGIEVNEDDGVGRESGDTRDGEFKEQSNSLKVLSKGDINKKHLNDQQNEDQPHRKRRKEIPLTKVVDPKNTHALDKVKQSSGQLNLVNHKKKLLPPPMSKLDKIGQSSKLDRVHLKNKILPGILPRPFSKKNRPVISVSQQSRRSFPQKSNPTTSKLKESSKVSKMDFDVELVELKKRQNNQEVTEAVPKIFKAELEEGAGDENQNHEALDTILCGVCYKPFSKNAGALIAHAETHGNEFGGKGKRKCTQCNDFAGHKTHLLMHMRAKHTEEKLFKCEVCNASFSTCAAKKSHQKKH